MALVSNLLVANLFSYGLFVLHFNLLRRNLRNFLCAKSPVYSFSYTGYIMVAVTSVLIFVVAIHFLAQI